MRRLSGKNLLTKVTALAASVILSASVFTGCGIGKTSEDVDYSQPVEITNVSYDPTRELYAAYNELFEKHWKELHGQDVTIVQSHGGSGKQALEVANGLEAQNYYRPSNKTILEKYATTASGNIITKLPADGKWIVTNVELVDISHFGGWSEATKKHFADGGIFDKIYEKK